MAVIEERKSKDGVSYRVKIRLKGHKPQEATFKRKTDAKNWATSTEAAIRENRYFKCAESKKRTVAELIDRYIEIILPEKSESMQASQAKQLAWWKDKAGYYLLADFTSQIITSLRIELANSPTPRGEKRTNATVNRYLAAISHVLTTAVNEWEWLETNPVLKKMHE